MAPDPGHDGSRPAPDAVTQAAATDIPGDLLGATFAQRRVIASEQMLVAYRIGGAIVEAARDELPRMAEEHGATLLTGAEILRQSVIRDKHYNGLIEPEDGARLRCANYMELLAGVLAKIGDATDTDLVLAANGYAVDLRATANAASAFVG